MPAESMKKTHGTVVSSMEQGWRSYLNSLEESIESLEKDIDQAGKNRDYCTEDWCFATEHVLEDLVRAAFSVSVPKTASQEDAERLRSLQRRVQNVYARFKSVPGYAPAGL
jgi:hypothetical protein